MDVMSWAEERAKCGLEYAEGGKKWTSEVPRIGGLRGDDRDVCTYIWMCVGLEEGSYIRTYIHIRDGA
jgi:hypothetical protein